MENNVLFKGFTKNIDSIFSPNNNKIRIDIIKDDDGKTYVPFLGINTIGNMNPYKGYYIYANSPLKFNYPNFTNNNTETRTNIKNEPWLATTFNLKPLRTGNNCVMIFPNEVLSDLLKSNDEIGVFDDKDNLLGSVKYFGEALALTAWGKDVNCEESCPGFIEDDNMVFRAWNSSNGSIKDLLINWEGNINVSYKYNGIFYANNISFSKTFSHSFDYVAMNNAIIFNKLDYFKYNIFNSIGQKIGSDTNIQNNKIELNELINGVYIIEIVVDEIRRSIKFIKC
ncbi:MAG: T9SS type A sorting domain-containing protein [Saprospiraceae bacterium]|nr:T9SS type A sorting domain-containing protein [Saprospiraceae bacterium]